MEPEHKLIKQSYRKAWFYAAIVLMSVIGLGSYITISVLNFIFSFTS